LGGNLFFPKNYDTLFKAGGLNHSPNCRKDFYPQTSVFRTIIVKYLNR